VPHIRSACLVFDVIAIFILVPTSLGALESITFFQQMLCTVTVMNYDIGIEDKNLSHLFV
jgi:hypothetical protein